MDQFVRIVWRLFFEPKAPEWREPGKRHPESRQRIDFPITRRVSDRVYGNLRKRKKLDPAMTFQVVTNDSIDRPVTLPGYLESPDLQDKTAIGNARAHDHSRCNFRRLCVVPILPEEPSCSWVSILMYDILAGNSSIPETLITIPTVKSLVTPLTE